MHVMDSGRADRLTVSLLFGFLSMAAQKNRNVRVAHDVLRIAAEHQPSHAAPSVGATNDQVGGPILRMAQDCRADRRAYLIEQRGCGGESGGPGASLGGLEQRIAAAAQCFREFSRVGSDAVRGHHDHVVQDVQQTQVRALIFGEFDRLLEPEVGGGTAINGNQDALVHSLSLVTRAARRAPRAQSAS